MPLDSHILIVGAGPAGCAAAFDLAQAGQRVLLLDRRTFPRPKACACGLTRKTLKALRYSVDPIVERVCHEIVLQPPQPGTQPEDVPQSPRPDTPHQDVLKSPQPDTPHQDVLNSPRPAAPGPASGTRAATEVRVHTRNPICAMAVRERFDDFCLQQTLASGKNGGSVTLRKIETILALRETAGSVELDIATAEGTETLRTPILIGADGSNGQTRRLATALQGTGFSPSVSSPATSAALAPEGNSTAADPAWYTKGFALEATIPYNDLPNVLPAGDHPLDLVFDFAPLPGGYGWLFPKGDHINIGVGAFAPAATEPGAPGPDSRTRASEAATKAATNLKAVTRQLLDAYCQQKLGVPAPSAITGQALGMGGHLYIPHGRILLTGDAAGLVDPLTGEGIHSAIVSGQAAAAAYLESARPGAPGPASGTRESITTIAELYAKHLQPLQQTLAFSHRAARAFYATPERGFRVMRTPLLRGLVLKTYADGLPHTKLLGRLARLVA